MSIFDLFKLGRKTEDYDWAIGKKGLTMTTGLGFAPKEMFEAAGNIFMTYIKSAK